MSKKSPRGFFLSFEGPEGSGKSTQIEALLKQLKRSGCKTLKTREPGGTEIGEGVRELLIHDSRGEKMFPEAELLLFAAARAQLVREVLLPALARGVVVVADRYLDSTTVYQGIARGISLEAVHAINAFAVGGLVPDLTILLDIPERVSAQRMTSRDGGKRDRIEREQGAFHRRVRRGYLTLARANPDRFLVMDGTESPEQIHAKIWQAVSTRISTTSAAAKKKIRKQK